MILTGLRSEAAHLPEQPLQYLYARAQITRVRLPLERSRSCGRSEWSNNGGRSSATHPLLTFNGEKPRGSRAHA
jgi:hypothetical protein